MIYAKRAGRLEKVYTGLEYEVRHLSIGTGGAEILLIPNSLSRVYMTAEQGGCVLCDASSCAIGGMETSDAGVSCKARMQTSGGNAIIVGHHCP